MVVTTPRWFPLNVMLPLPLLSSILSSASLHLHLHVTQRRTLLLFAELPYGWEEIDDPQYGTYYVE